MTQNTHPADERIELDREIIELEQTLFALKQRCADTQLAAQEQLVLTRHRNELKHQGSKQSETRQELEQIKSRLTELDLILESRLLNEWRLMWEPFWQAVRFGGLGLAIGWVLASWGRC